VLPNLAVSLNVGATPMRFPAFVGELGVDTSAKSVRCPSRRRHVGRGLSMATMRLVHFHVPLNEVFVGADGFVQQLVWRTMICSTRHAGPADSMTMKATSGQFAPPESPRRWRRRCGRSGRCASHRCPRAL